MGPYSYKTRRKWKRKDNLKWEMNGRIEVGSISFHIYYFLFIMEIFLLSRKQETQKLYGASVVQAL